MTIILSIISIYCIAMMIAWDLRARIIPDIYLFPFMLCGLLLVPTLPWLSGDITESAIAAATGYLVGFLLNAAFKYFRKKSEMCRAKAQRRRTCHAVVKRRRIANSKPVKQVVIPEFCKAKCLESGQIDYDPIGMGDIKLLAAGGIWLGTMGLSTALIVSCLAGAVWGKIRHQKFVPFAPFFFAGMTIAIIVMLV